MRFVVVGLALIGCKSGGDGDTDEPGKPDDGCVAEVPYDDIDQDCNGADLVDVDDDGHDASEVGGTDCDDDDPEIHPDAEEIPYDDIDQDCADGDLLDADGDGELPLSEGGVDCDDNDALTYPGAPDTTSDGTDNNCDGLDGVDTDQDGFASKNSGGDDCNDADLEVNPAAVEVWYDGIDQNCDRICDYDQDDDGAVAPGSDIPNGSPCDQEPGPEWWAPEDCDDLDPLVNDVEISRTGPADGEHGVAEETWITVTLTEADPAPSLVVVDVSTGLEVPGTLFASADAMEWQPDAPLAAGTLYRVDVTHGCGLQSFSFTTDYEVVPVDPAALVGRVWNLDLASGTWTEPEDLGVLFASLLSSGLMMEVLDPSLAVRIATQEDLEQDLCAPTVDTVADYSANPALVIGPADVSLNAAGIPVDLVGATIEAGVRLDGAILADASVTAELDTQSFELLLGGGGPSAFCDLSAALGAPCFECSSGAGLYCLDVRIDDVYGAEMESPIVPRSEADIDADPACP